jgi:hypothetical protein
VPDRDRQLVDTMPELDSTYSLQNLIRTICETAKKLNT